MVEILDRIQSTELEILEYFHNFCMENNLKYSLSGGTLLGAIRHNGFIPWDDDVDVMMLREDYNRLISLWPKDCGYVIQIKENAPEFTQSFLKIRKDNTTFIHDNDKPGKYHTGLFIDVMPADRVPDGRPARKLYFVRAALYQLLMREYPSKKNGKAMYYGTKAALAVIPKGKRSQIREKMLSHITKYNGRTDLDIISVETISSLKRFYSSDLMDKIITHDFCGKEFCISSKWEEILTVCYGNYMELPPVEEREWKHHPTIIDFERNYEDLPAGERK